VSTTATPDLSAATIIERIDSGEYARDVVLTIAQGFLPLPQDDLIGVLAYLSGNDDAEVADVARMSLEEVPLRAAMAFATNEAMAGAHLGNLLRATRDSSVVEALIRNRSLPDNDIIVLAGRAEPAVQEVIVINQARILRAPQILEMLLINPKLSPDVRRRALETREEFFEKKARAQEEAEEAGAEEAAILAIPLDAIADLLERADGEPQAASPPPQLLDFEKKDEEKASVWAKIQKMTVAQKVMLAFRGDKTCRMILVRDRNKLVCTAVMRNPRRRRGHPIAHHAARLDAEVHHHQHSLSQSEDPRGGCPHVDQSFNLT
jgi:hypothetical protein